MEIEPAVKQGPEEAEFDFGAGLLCLDFANTADWHAAQHPIEALNSYADLVRWASIAQILSPEVASSLLEQARRRPEEAGRSLARAIELREAIYGIFTAYANLQPVDPLDLTIFNQFLRTALSHSQLEIHGQVGVWVWEEQSLSLERPFWPVVRSALDVITSEQLQRVGQCQDDRGCGWLFLDTSRNRSRRWCSMEFCGNRAKAHRHYDRAKKE